MTTPEDCTPRCRQFLEELQRLCDRYEVFLTPSGTDALQIWKRLPGDKDAFDWQVIADCTDVEQDEVPADA